MAKLVDQLNNRKNVSNEDNYCPNNKPVEIIYAPTTKKPQASAAITAETCIDSQGQAKAKISVTTNQNDDKKETLKINDDVVPYQCQLVEDDCQRRNGLDSMEPRGLKKFACTPAKFKVAAIAPTPRNDDRCAKIKPIYLSDNLSSKGSNSCLKAPRLITTPMIPGLRESCAKSLPEERLIKYKACLRRRNGLQDECDPLTRKVLKKCCKVEKC